MLPQELVRRLVRHLGVALGVIEISDLDVAARLAIVADKALRLITFRVGVETFVLDIMAVRQIIPYTGSTTLPTAPEASVSSRCQAWSRPKPRCAAVTDFTSPSRNRTVSNTCDPCVASR